MMEPPPPPPPPVVGENEIAGGGENTGKFEGTGVGVDAAFAAGLMSFATPAWNTRHETDSKENIVRVGKQRVL